MKTSIKDSAPCEKVLSVSVSQDLIREEYDFFYTEMGKQAKVPGFRPGKAPREILEQHFKEQAKEKVLENLVSRSLRDALKDKQVEFLGRPTIQGIEFTLDKLSYEAVLEVAPEIKLGKYRGLSAKKAEVKVQPNEVEETLKRIQESLAKYSVVENRAAAMGDFLIADYTLTVDGKEAEKRTDDWFELKEGEFLKGFSTQLVGVKAGEEREVKIEFPENFGRKEWAGKTGTFQVKVKELKEKKVAPFDDELAKETGEFQTIAELRQQIEKQIEAEKSRKADIDFETALLDLLLKETSFPLPKGVVEKRLGYLAQSTLEDLHRRSAPKEILEKEAKAIIEKLKPEAEKQVRLSFLLEAIAKKEKLKLSEADFGNKYKETAERHRQNEDAIAKYYSEHPEAKESLGMQILNEKVVQLIKDSSK